MSKDNGSVVPVGVASGVVVGVLWTVIAGTLWQWVPIAAAIAAVYGVTRVFESVADETKTRKGKK